jgi:hypothetical protein
VEKEDEEKKEEEVEEMEVFFSHFPIFSRPLATKVIKGCGMSRVFFL